MPKKKKVVEVPEPAFSGPVTALNVPIIKEPVLGITELEPGVRHETDVLVSKINEIIRKLN